MIIASFPSSPWQANCYLVAAGRGGQVVIIDPGLEAAAVVESALQEYDWTPAGVLLTHGHVDHIGDAARLANEHGIGVWMHPDDDFMLTEPARGLGVDSIPILTQLSALQLPAPTIRHRLAGVAGVDLAGLHFGVQHAPGHSPGSVIYTVQDAEGPLVWCGDVVFAGSIGRSDLPGGDQAILSRSLRDKILTLPDSARLLPGHGPTSTVGRERRTNPYLQADFLEQTS